MFHALVRTVQHWAVERLVHPHMPSLILLTSSAQRSRLVLLHSTHRFYLLDNLLHSPLLIVDSKTSFGLFNGVGGIPELLEPTPERVSTNLNWN